MSASFASDTHAWVVITLASALVAGWLIAVRRADQTVPRASGKSYFAVTAAITGLWLVYTAQLALRGRLLEPESMPPPFLRVMGPGLILVFLAAFSPLGLRLAKHLGYPC